MKSTSKNCVVRLLAASLLTFGLASWAIAGSVTLPYTQAFNTDTGSPNPTFGSLYPEFTPNLNGGTATVVGNKLFLTGANASGPNVAVSLTPNFGPTGQITVTADFGFDAAGAAGSFGTGFVFNNQLFQFFGGVGDLGYYQPGNAGGIKHTGITDAADTSYHVEFSIFSDNSLIIDVNNGAYTSSSITGFNVYGGDVNLHVVGGGSGNNYGFYDNLTISQTPEPSSFLLSLGLFGAFYSARNRARKLNVSK